MNETTNNGKQTTAITRDGLGGSELMRSETASEAMSAKQTAIVQARITQALARPRRLSVVREDILADCDRPMFAQKAIYARPQGQKKVEHPDGRVEWVPNIIEGLSIRFVEAAVQAMGNIEASTIALYEDDKKKIVRVEVCDLQRNVPWSAEVTIEKTIERSRLKKNQVPIASRLNSYGETVYILPATDDETRLKENRLVSMTVRTLALRIIPADILEEARERCEAVRYAAAQAERAGITADPTRARKDLLDRLAKIGIRATDVADYLGGKEITTATPDQILELRAIGAGVSSGEFTWREALEGSPYREQSTAAGEPTEESEAAKKARERITAKVDAAKDKKKKAPPAEPPPAAAPAAAAPPPPPSKPAAPGDGVLTPEEEAAAFGGGQS